jgi:hypothetical protein
LAESQEAEKVLASVRLPALALAQLSLPPKRASS